MNINANELLLLNKKIRFGEGEEIAKSVNPAIPGAETEKPQTGMNTLMFEGLNNLMANPSLAQKLGVMKDAPEQKESAENFVAPYQSNIAFQGKAGKLKNLGMAALMALTTLGGASTVTSCSDGDTVYNDNSTIIVDNDATIIFDMKLFQELLDEIKAMREDAAKQNEEMAKKYDQILTMMNSMLSLMQDQQLTNEAFQTLILANQQTMIDIMVANGMKQDEATKKLDDILKAVEDGNLSAQEALKQITELLNNISTQLGSIIQDLKEHFKNDEVVNSYLEKIYESSKENNENQAETTELLNKLYEAVENLGTKGDAMGKEILKYIAAVGFEMNRNFSALIEKVGNDSTKLDSVVEVLEDINKNVEKNGEDGKKLGNQILEYIAAVGFEMNRNFSQLIENAGNDSAKLDSLIELMEKLNANVEKNGEDGKQLGNQILNYIAAVGFEMNRNFTALLEKVGNDPAKLDEVIALLEKLNANVEKNGEEGKQLGNQILEYIAAVGFEMNRNFTTLIEKVGNDPEKLNEVIALLEKINANVEKNGEDGKELGNQILEYIATVGFEMNNNFKAVLEAINKGTASSDDIKSFLQKVLENQDKNTEAIINAMGNIKIDGGNIDLSSLEKMMADLLEQAKNNGDILASIDAKADVINITIERAKEEIIEKLGKNDDNAKDIIAKLDEFISISNGNSEAILKKMDTIINILNNIKDKTYDDSALMAKLDDILAAIKDHNITVDVTGKVTCNCNCGGNHEGIINDINKLLE